MPHMPGDLQVPSTIGGCWLDPCSNWTIVSDQGPILKKEMQREEVEGRRGGVSDGLRESGKIV